MSSDLETKNEPMATGDDADTKTSDHVMSLDSSEHVGPIVLTSSDSKSFTIEKKSAFISKLVSQALENDTCASEVPVPGAKGASLELVVQYMTHHNGTEPPIIEKPLRSKLMKDVCKDKWDAEFIDTIGNDRQALYDLILAANYMDVKSLLHLGCAKVASLIKGQTLEKIKSILAVDQSANKSSESKTETKTPEATDVPVANSSSGGTASGETAAATAEDEDESTSNTTTIHTDGQ